MSPTELLKDAEADLASLAGLPGEIRAKVKAGIAELTRIRDAIDAEIARLTGGAKDTLDALQALGTTTPETPPAAADPTPGAGDGKPPLSF